MLLIRWTSGTTEWIFITNCPSSRRHSCCACKSGVRLKGFFCVRPAYCWSQKQNDQVIAKMSLFETEYYSYKNLYIYRRQWHQQDSPLVCHLQFRRLHRARGYVLPFLQIAGNGGEAPDPIPGLFPGPNWGTSVFLITWPHTITRRPWPRQWVRNHRTRGRTPTFTNSWARRTTWGKQETDQSPPRKRSPKWLIVPVEP